MARRSAALAACLALAVAGCGGDDEETAATQAPETGATAEQRPDTGAADTEGGATEGDVVVARDIEFVPEEIRVGAGSTVTWRNEDPVPHTVTKESGPGDSFDEPLPPDGTVEVTFRARGTVEYVCTIHPGMDGRVIVE